MPPRPPGASGPDESTLVLGHMKDESTLVLGHMNALASQRNRSQGRQNLQSLELRRILERISPPAGNNPTKRARSHPAALRSQPTQSPVHQREGRDSVPFAQADSRDSIVSNLRGLSHVASSLYDGTEGESQQQQSSGVITISQEIPNRRVISQMVELNFQDGEEQDGIPRRNRRLTALLTRKLPVADAIRLAGNSVSGCSGSSDGLRRSTRQKKSCISNSRSRRLDSDDDEQLSGMSGSEDEYVANASEESEEDDMSDEDVASDDSVVGSRRNSGNKRGRGRGRGGGRRLGRGRGNGGEQTAPAPPAYRMQGRIRGGANNVGANGLGGALI